MTLDVELFNFRGMSEVDDVEQFPDLKHVMMDGSLAREVAGGRRNFDLVIRVLDDPATSRKLFAWFLDTAGTLTSLAATPTTLAAAAATGSITGTGHYIVTNVDAVGESALPTEVSRAMVGAGTKLTWDAMAGSHFYKIYRQMDSGPWFVLDYSTTNSYTDSGAVTPWSNAGVGAAHPSVINYVQENPRMTSVRLNNFRKSLQYSFRLNEALLVPGRLFPV